MVSNINHFKKYMTNILYPSNEIGRLQALNELLILNTPAEERFDRIVEYAADHFEMPIVAIHLIGEESTWFKSIIGLPQNTQYPREVALCSHAILNDDIMVVEDTSVDERFHENSIVKNHPNITFYAGAPLKLPSGHTIGAFCLIDTKPRKLGETDLSMLACLRNVVVNELLQTNSIIDNKSYFNQPTNELFNFVELLGRQNLHAAINYLNSRTPHRFTAVYKFEGEVLKNICLVDKFDSKVNKSADALICDSYCSLLTKALSIDMLSHIPADYPKLSSMVEAYGGVLIMDEFGNPFGSLCHYDLKRCEVNINDIPLLKKTAPLIYKYLKEN